MDFIVWPVVGGIVGWLITTVCYLNRMYGSNPSFDLGLAVPVISSILVASTWAGRHQPRCYLTLWTLTVLLGVLFWTLAPQTSGRPIDLANVVFGSDHIYFFARADFVGVGSTLAAIYGLVRWTRVLRKEEELSLHPSVISVPSVVEGFQFLESNNVR